MTPNLDALRRGWCPGAMRPMQSGDGLLVRIKPSCGILSLAQLDDIARLAQAHGNGILELTSRGNLQLRGVRDAALAELTQALDRMALLDASPEAEARRNVITSPLAGLDLMAFDTRAVVKELEAALVSATDLAGLSDKFGIVVDGGGLLPLHNVDADIRVAWTGATFAIGLAREVVPGDTRLESCEWIGTCPPTDVRRNVITLVRAFLAAGGTRRMRSVGADARRSIARASFDSEAAAWSPEAMPSNTAGLRILGCLASAARASADEPPSNPAVGSIGWPYGATTSTRLQALVATARSAGVADVRLTPWRASLMPLPDGASGAVLMDQAARLGFIVDAADPRRWIAACPGAPACGNGSTAVRADAGRIAAALAGVLGPDMTLHISGCSKGCARRQPADLTLVADAGRYGLVVNGTAAEPTSGALTPDEAVETLACLARAMTQAGYEPPAGIQAALAAALKEIQAA